MKTTLIIDDELLRRAKLRAADRGTTLTAVVDEALRATLAESGRPDTKPLDFPTFRGVGAPAVDVADRKALYDALGVRGPAAT